ncbi:neuroblastoma-amplified sequence-like [Pseudomyrmex gracilis]|uniref:neuroblastoma-amplified sequence-like n=1 Tax=Pseudomyrmex gracilis TaxID=219809 RepID=UPI000995A793|nr:neuroblastoma-amplified sequence-like [Pseudomyrmex gracilis]
MSNLDETSNEPILYELLEYFVWKQEPELIKCKNDAVILPTPGTIKNALRYLNNRYSLPENITQQVSLTLPWKLAVGDHGRVLAILQENVIEIRKAKDEYSSIVGKASAPRDAFPQWRKLAWSPDGMMLALASSSGYTSFYNTIGNNVFNISPKTISQNPNVLEAGDAIASMLFLKPRIQNQKWAYEFILISYSGLLRSYHISTNSFIVNYDFSFDNFYKNGINSVAYDERHSLFYVAGNMITQKLTSTASESGLTSWRLLDDHPYCKLSFTFENAAINKSRLSIWNLIPIFSFQPESFIFLIKISSNGEFLICLHTDGSISLWGLPNLILQKKWKLFEQPEYNVPNPLGLTKSKKFPGFTTKVTEFHPIDIGWWSDQAVIVARYSGSTSVCSTWNLKNLLGVSPEFLAGQPQICELGSEKGFLCLDCETFITSKKRSRELNDLSEASSESEKDDDELEPVTILNYTTNLVQSALYSITDIERFQPKRKKSKVLHRTYRILGLKSTTPEELYSRKIDIEEYEEALALANTYNLDTDLVYQTQWRKSELSLNAITEHLSKISKRSWVLNECVVRVPDTVDAARELLNFGLRGANLETLIAIDICDNDKFVIPDTDEDWQAPHESSVQKINKMFEKIDIKNLSEAQKNLIKYRRKLLSHLDKLLTYEIILEPPHKYKKEFYEEFRRMSAVENAIRFAKDGDCRSVEIMFIYYGKSLLPHWLAIISFFPETLNPVNYQKLLPECDAQGHLFLLDQRELREKDWSEKPEFNEVINLDLDDRSEILYESNPSLLIYRNTELTPQLLQKWYKTRACEIEKNSAIVDNALQLVKIAKSHNINGVEDLLLDLETLDDLVYKVYLEDMSLDKLEKLTNVEKIKLLMSTSTENNFVENIKTLLLPFIKRRHQYLGGEPQKHLLSDYLICLSKDDLTFPVKVFEYLKETQDNEILEMIDDIATLALDCVYACNDVDMYEKAKIIVDSISKDHDRKKTNAICDIWDELKEELNCIRLLNKYDVKITLKFVQENKNNPDTAKSLLIQTARSLSKRLIPPDEKEWAELLSDMLDVHGSMFNCIGVETCFEICVSARLASGIKLTIQNCATLIETKKNEKSLVKVSYEKAIDLILEATKEYFNGSKTFTDPNMELAKTCLNLIEDDNGKIKEERDLIKSLQILNEFNIDMLPLQVRLTTDKLTLIEHCLNSQRDAYKCEQRLLTLATYLRIEGNNKRCREGKILELIAKKALKSEDYTACATICIQLAENSYISAWEICLNLGCCNNYRDLKVRKKCLWFAINNGPSDILSTALEHVHLIEFQMLDKNLESWLSLSSSICYKSDRYSEKESVKFENNKSEDVEYSDVENDEYPTYSGHFDLLSDSTKPLERTNKKKEEKKSLSIMKKYTSFLIHNMTSTIDYFDSKCNSEINAQCEADGEQNEENINAQSFPCYYESLHKMCRISPNETRYNKYSMPDKKINLKCYQALLRTFTLSESTYCRFQTTEYNHLVLECARYTITDDWLLGMAYLMSLNRDRIMDAQKIFSAMPNELYIHTAIYYYSLELYKKLYTECENLYLYKPLNLMENMIVAAQKSEDCDIVKALRYWHCYLLGDSQIARPELAEMRDTKRSVNKGKEVTEEDILNSIEKVRWRIRLASEAANAEENRRKQTKGTVGTVTDRKDKSKSKEILQQATVHQWIAECATEEDRFVTFHKLFNLISNIEQYRQVRKIISQWPKFKMSEYTTLNNHPILVMLEVMLYFISRIKGHVNDFDKTILQEIEELTGLLESEILEHFLEWLEHIDIEYILYIKLCSKDTSIHKKVVDFIINEEEDKKSWVLHLPAIVLEKLFQNNLTALFKPDHPVYKQIIRHIFMDEKIFSELNIEENAKMLLQEFKKQNYIPEAMYIIKLMKRMPSAVCTFDTCFELLMEL